MSSAEGHATRHPRTIGWAGTTALAMGGSNQSLFLIGALFASQGSAAVPLLIVGLVLSWMALPGWIELIMMWPNRIGGIAASCAEAFRPYSPVLANLTGVCYWWGWIPTCGLTALLSASALHQWYVPWMPAKVLAALIVLAFTAVNLWGGVRWVTRLAIPIATASAGLAVISAVAPIGQLNWHRATTFHLSQPFPGTWGAVTSAMAGLYLIGFAAPAFEAAACHVGETVRWSRNVPRAMFASAAMATLYFAILPVVWLGVLGSGPLHHDLTTVLGPTFSPLLGGGAAVAAVWFMVFNMFHGTLQPLAGAARTLSQLAEDGLVPRVLALRARSDTPWVATSLTAGMSLLFLLTGDPTWVIAAANLTYLIGIGMPSVAVWLLRRNEPNRRRPWRAPRFTVGLGLIAALCWGIATVLGFEQFGLPTVLAGIALAYAGAGMYAARLWSDRRAAGLRGFSNSIHIKLTGAMLAVLTLDGVGYLLAVARVDTHREALIVVLEDIFVAVALLSITVGLVLPGTIAHALTSVTGAADRLAAGTVADLTRALHALGEGDLDHARARVDLEPLDIRSRDEVGRMAGSFNAMQLAVSEAAGSLDDAREGLRAANVELERLAFNDPLTALANRTLFKRHLDLAVERRRRSDGCVAVMFIDLDDFKLVNDSFGHSAGDELLRQAADRLRTVTRRSDVVARQGGDEFLCLIDDVDAEGAEVIAGKIVEVLNPPFIVASAEVYVSASVGVSVFPLDADSSEELLKHADIAMYTAKHAGRNNAQLYARTTDSALAQLSLTSSLHRALERDEFVLHYQPIFDLISGRMLKAEALVRWNHPERGLVLPGEFISNAERNGLIAPISNWVAREACRQSAAWQREGLDLPVAFNLPPALWQPGLMSYLLTTMAEFDLVGDRLIVEITESALSADPGRGEPLAEQLRAAGLQLAIDDFGTGHSSLSRLAKLPVSTLKIDGSFIRDIPEHPAAATLVTSIIQLAHNLGLEALAEGIETPAQREFLISRGCTVGQGFLLSHPLPAEEIPALHWASLVEEEAA